MITARMDEHNPVFQQERCKQTILHVVNTFRTCKDNARSQFLRTENVYERMVDASFRERKTVTNPPTSEFRNDEIFYEKQAIIIYLFVK